MAASRGRRGTARGRDRKASRRGGTGQALPPIPGTPEGIRIAAIADTIRALNEPTEYSPMGLELQDEEFIVYGKRLGVPAAFIAAVYSETYSDHPQQTACLEEYCAWRAQLARKAVA